MLLRNWWDTSQAQWKPAIVAKFVNVSSQIFFWTNVKQTKSIHIIEFSGKKADWESLCEKFLLHGKQKGCNKLLLSSRSTLGMDKIPTQNEYKNALEGDRDLNKKIIKIGYLNKLAYEDIIL